MKELIEKAKRSTGAPQGEAALRFETWSVSAAGGQKAETRTSLRIVEVRSFSVLGVLEIEGGLAGLCIDDEDLP